MNLIVLENRPGRQRHPAPEDLECRFPEFDLQFRRGSEAKEKTGDEHVCMRLQHVGTSIPQDQDPDERGLVVPMPGIGT